MGAAVRSTTLEVIGEAAAPRHRRLRPGNWMAHLILLVGVAVFVFPVFVALIGSTHDAGTIARGEMPLALGPHTIENYQHAWTSAEGERVKGVGPVRRMMLNSFIMGVVIAAGKIAISIISAFAVAFFEFPLRMFFFWMIFITLTLPVEVRIIPTFKVVSDLAMINTFQGLIVPLIASATATLIFRQFFLTVPDELVDAAKIDGAGPMRFFWSILLPLSSTTIAALSVILFIYGWNQYLWPLLITSSREMNTIVIGITKMIGASDAQTDWQLILATAVLAMVPPVAVIVATQHWFVKGLTETEK